MNILEAEDIIKGLPDQSLMQEAQAPSGQVPQFLVVSEIQRRTDMRKRYEEQQPNQGTVKDQILQQGIMGAMPPQMPAGMPPQMPAGMPPQGMPPQQMFSGGIIRLQEGGSTGMPGEYALVPLMEKAKDLARITGRRVEDIYDYLVRQAQENMPDYSMIAPAGVGDLPSLPDLGQTDVALPARSRGEGVDSARESYTPQEINLPSGTNFLSSIAEGMRQTPFGKYSRAAEQGIMDVYEKDGLAAGIGEFGRATLGGLLSLGETVAEGYKPAAKALVGATDYLTSGPAEALDQFFTGSTEDPLTLGDIAGYFGGGSGDDERAAAGADSGLDPTKSDVPVLTEAIVTAQRLTNDASKKGDGVGLLYEDDGILGMPSGTGSREVQGTSGIQAQGTPGKTEPSLDFADLIAESKKAGMANALMQLGAGIAGGDLSKGISAAGVAATKGQQDAKAIAMRQRLAEYQAGREDIARDRKNYEFKALFDQAERKISAELQKAERVSKGQLISFVSDIVKEAAPDFPEEGQSRQEVIDALTQQLLVKYAPFLDVDVSSVKMGMPAAPAPSQSQSGWGISGR